MRFSRSRRALALAAAVTFIAIVPTAFEQATAAGPNCGTAVPKATGGYWTCTFADEFSGSALSSARWVALTTAASGYTNNYECYTNSRNNVSVGNGVLSLTVRKEASPFTCKSPWGSWTTQYTGGFATTWSKFSQAHGRYEIRAKFPPATVAGLQSALWLWPNDANRYGAWPASGEIDIAEFYSQYPDRAIPYIHYTDGGTDPNVTNNWCMLDPSQFHTYLLEWTTTTMTIKYDGQTCVEDTWDPIGFSAPAPFDQPFYLNLTQALGMTTNSLTESTPFPGTTQVDYVHVWS
jgi:beta-glucanase (GH16 family)